ncbi:MAG: CHAT domain-containing protein [Arachnia sp.]
MARAAPAALTAAREAYEQARSALAAYRIAEAMSYLDESLRLLDAATGIEAQELVWRVRISRTWADEPSRANAELAQVTQEAAAAGCDVAVALAHIQRGVLAARHGDLASALAALRLAGATEAALPKSDRVRLLINRGTIAAELLELEPASADLALAATIAAQAGLDEFAFMATHNRGYVEFVRGDLPTALRLMMNADAMPAPVDRAVALHDRARVLLESGLVNDARDTLEQALHACRAGEHHAEGDDVELDLARCDLLLGLNDAAEQRARRVGERYRERGATSRRVQAGLLRIQAQAWGDEVTTLPEVAAELAADARATDRRLGQLATTLLARVELASGRPEAAVASLAGARGLMRSTSLANRSLARRVQAEVAIATGHSQSAHRLLRDAATDLRHSRRGMSSLDLRTGLATHLEPLTDLDVSLALQRRDPRRVLTVTERWRTALGPMASVRPIASGREAELWSQLRQVNEAVRLAQPGTDFAPLRRRAREIMRALREASWTHDSSDRPDAGPAAVSGLSDALTRTESTLVSRVPHGGQLAAVVGRPAGRLRLIDIGAYAPIIAQARQVATEVEALARVDAGSILRRGIEGSLNQTLSAIAASLLDPLGELPGNLVLVPNQALAYLPWSMLPGLRGRPVSVARSATQWLRGAKQVSAPSAAVLRGPELATGEAEQQQVAGAWGAAAAGVASSEDLGRALASVDLVHLAAHGKHEPNNPLFSSLLLRDGPTFAHEFEHREIRASHVVLSACRTAAVNVHPGDEPLGLAACLLTFGVSSVVAPVSLVDEAAATPTMAAYHRGLAAGLDNAHALAEATADGPLTAAAFSCLGSTWSVRPG